VYDRIVELNYASIVNKFAESDYNYTQMDDSEFWP